ncbi:hypothetical protein NCC49_004776 [Naganishia albida]|nr:hypothetical protein NCC49_004776 [Naganishia albida]
MSAKSPNENELTEKAEAGSNSNPGDSDELTALRKAESDASDALALLKARHSDILNEIENLQDRQYDDEQGYKNELATRESELKKTRRDMWTHRRNMELAKLRIASTTELEVPGSSKEATSELDCSDTGSEVGYGPAYEPSDNGSEGSKTPEMISQVAPGSVNSSESR